jgi:uncharacterized membrane protein YjgN (DUF898 family)
MILGVLMPILFMALLALLAFIAVGVLCFAAVVSESRQAEKNARKQAAVPVRKAAG